MNLQKELVLPCGAKLQNRMAKSAMSENMSPRHHSPTKAIIHAYKRWADGGSGLLITGNIMVDRKAIGEPGNVIVEDKRDFNLLQQWASVAKRTGIHLWPQINHPGRQAIGFINKEVVAPSAVRTNVRGMSAMFKKPRALTEPEILDLIDRFGNTAAILKEAGFTGVQIHGAHGYLVSQFLSPVVNLRKDKWGGSLENRSRFVLEIYRNIRKKVGSSFPIGIKINSADFQRGGFTEEESMKVVQLLGAEGMDLIEISGGSYERPAMTGVYQKKSTQEREAYFLDYVKNVRKLLQTPLMLTGGFRTVATMERAIAEGELDVVGIARPFTLYPDLPNRIFEGNLTHLDIPTPKTGFKMLDTSGFVDIKWHEIHIHRLGKGKKSKPNLSAYSVIGHNLLETMKKLVGGMNLKILLLSLFFLQPISGIAQTANEHYFSFELVDEKNDKITLNDVKTEKIEIFVADENYPEYFLSYDFKLQAFTLADYSTYSYNLISIVSDSGVAYVFIDRTGGNRDIRNPIKIRLESDTAYYLIKNDTINIADSATDWIKDIWADAIVNLNNNKQQLKLDESNGSYGTSVRLPNSYRLIKVSMNKRGVGLLDCTDSLRMFYGKDLSLISECYCAQNGWRIPKSIIEDNTWVVLTKKSSNNLRSLDSMILFILSEEELYHSIIDTISFERTTVSHNTIPASNKLKTSSREVNYIDFYQYALMIADERYFISNRYRFYTPGFRRKINFKFRTNYPNGQLSLKGVFRLNFVQEGPIKMQHPDGSGKNVYSRNFTIQPTGKWKFYDRQGNLFRNNKYE